MTFRERIADWISGGALSRCLQWADLCQAETDRARAEMHGALLDIRAAEKRASRNHNALMLIAAEEKPTSNATVKRMARIARQAMEGRE